MTPEPQATDTSSGDAAPIVDFTRAARRVRRSALLLFPAALVGWLVVGVLGRGPDPADLGAWGGLALLGMFLVEVVVVGGSALRGMLAAGDRGERLAGGDVGLLPPQLTGRRGPRAPGAPAGVGPATDDAPTSDAAPAADGPPDRAPVDEAAR